MVAAKSALGMGPPSLQFAIISGAVMPPTNSPLATLLHAMRDNPDASIPTLHCLSRSDPRGPRAVELGEELAECFAPSAELLWHDGGSSLPNQYWWYQTGGFPDRATGRQEYVPSMYEDTGPRAKAPEGRGDRTIYTPRDTTGLAGMVTPSSPAAQEAAAASRAASEAAAAEKAAMAKVAAEKLAAERAAAEKAAAEQAAMERAVAERAVAERAAAEKAAAERAAAEKAAADAELAAALKVQSIRDETRRAIQRSVSLPGPERKKLLQEWRVQWHPDRARRMPLATELGRDVTMELAREISQLVNDAMAKAKENAKARGESF